ncbi:MAG: hypothetical protein DMG07_20150 [Acidobacteria bacterium]|nr:MAG: hypothetical protein DMG07_20150 [Acidobacteriota bacterium]
MLWPDELPVERQSGLALQEHEVPDTVTLGPHSGGAVREVARLLGSKELSIGHDASFPLDLLAVTPELGAWNVIYYSLPCGRPIPTRMTA